MFSPKPDKLATRSFFFSFFFSFLFHCFCFVFHLFVVLVGWLQTQARDAFYACLEKESSKTPTEIASVGLLYPFDCKGSRVEFVKHCRASWVRQIPIHSSIDFTECLSNFSSFTFWFWEFMFWFLKNGRWSILIGSTVGTEGCRGFWMTRTRGEVRWRFHSLTLLSLRVRVFMRIWLSGCFKAISFCRHWWIFTCTAINRSMHCLWIWNLNLWWLIIYFCVYSVKLIALSLILPLFGGPS